MTGMCLTCKTLAFILSTDKKQGKLGSQFWSLGGEAFSLLRLPQALESYHILGACKNHQTRKCFIFNNHCFINFEIYYHFIINYGAHEYLQTCPRKSQSMFHACFPKESCLQLVCFCLTYRSLLRISSSHVLKCPPHILERGRRYLLVRNCWIPFPARPVEGQLQGDTSGVPVSDGTIKGSYKASPRSCSVKVALPRGRDKSRDSGN